MSGKVKQRSAANVAEHTKTNINEKLLKDCNRLYTDPEMGLVHIAKELDVHLLAPRKKIIVVLVGNHSAGKSSFINWYIEEHVQKTGVAIETQGFTFVTSGRKRETLTGEATLHLYPHFDGLRKIPGVVNYLTTEISTSKQKKFSLVTFVDTPGLVDGDMKYGFDVNEAIEWLGNMADLVFVFFDPIGQALCKRTLNLVESINEERSDLLRFYLSKADEAGHESDRQRVMMQIVQELCKRPGLNKTGFDMPTIYIPNPNKPSRCVNQIEEACREIEKTINLTVQNSLNQLERDCVKVMSHIDERLVNDDLASQYNRSLRWRALIYGLMGLMLPMLVGFSKLMDSRWRPSVDRILGEDLTETLQTTLAPLSLLLDLVPSEYWYVTWVGLFLFFVIMLLLGRFGKGKKSVMRRKDRKHLEENRQYVLEYIKPQKVKLYEEYLQQSVVEGDF